MTQAHHIFNHFGFIYVLDFENMLCWVLGLGEGEDQETDSPITALDIARKAQSRWFFRAAETAAPFQEDTDSEWSYKVENLYKSYINELVATPDRIVN